MTQAEPIYQEETKAASPEKSSARTENLTVETSHVSSEQQQEPAPEQSPAYTFEQPSPASVSEQEAPSVIAMLQQQKEAASEEERV